MDRKAMKHLSSAFESARDDYNTLRVLCDCRTHLSNPVFPQQLERCLCLPKPQQALRNAVYAQYESFDPSECNFDPRSMIQAWVVDQQVVILLVPSGTKGRDVCHSMTLLGPETSMLCSTRTTCSNPMQMHK